jgi:hypothetical protein
MPGYIKNVGDHIRMRYVQPGYDPDATDVPPNKVIFDSDDLGTLSVLASGVVSIPTAISSYVQLVEWDLDYVPLCWIQFDNGDGYLRNAGGTSVAVGPNRVNIRTTGIWYKGFASSGTSLIYAAFRVKAA